MTATPSSQSDKPEPESRKVYTLHATINGPGKSFARTVQFELDEDGVPRNMVPETRMKGILSEYIIGALHYQEAKYRRRHNMEPIERPVLKKEFEPIIPSQHKSIERHSSNSVFFGFSFDEGPSVSEESPQEIPPVMSPPMQSQFQDLESMQTNERLSLPSMATSNPFLNLQLSQEVITNGIPALSQAPQTTLFNSMSPMGSHFANKPQLSPNIVQTQFANMKNLQINPNETTKLFNNSYFPNTFPTTNSGLSMTTNASYSTNMSTQRLPKAISVFNPFSIPFTSFIKANKPLQSVQTSLGSSGNPQSTPQNIPNPNFNRGFETPKLGFGVTKKLTQPVAPIQQSVENTSCQQSSSAPRGKYTIKRYMIDDITENESDAPVQQSDYDDCQTISSGKRKK